MNTLTIDALIRIRPSRSLQRALRLLVSQTERLANWLRPQTQPTPVLGFADDAVHSHDMRRSLRVECVAGCVWITRDGDPVDVVLEAGCTHHAARGAPMLVSAFGNASYRLGLDGV